MSSRRIEDLHPDLQPLCRKFIIECNREFQPNARVFVVCTYRSVEEQTALKAKYGTTRRIASPGKSKHGLMLDGYPAAEAFDAMVSQYGKLVERSDDPLYKRMGEIAARCGLVQPYPENDANHFEKAPK